MCSIGLYSVKVGKKRGVTCLWKTEVVETTFLVKQDNDPNHSSKTELLIIWYLGSAHQTNHKKAVGGASRSLEYHKSHSQSLRQWLLQIYKVWGEIFFSNIIVCKHENIYSLRPDIFEN